MDWFFVYIVSLEHMKVGRNSGWERGRIIGREMEANLIIILILKFNIFKETNTFNDPVFFAGKY